MFGFYIGRNVRTPLITTAVILAKGADNSLQRVINNRFGGRRIDGV